MRELERDKEAVRREGKEGDRQVGKRGRKEGRNRRTDRRRELKLKFIWSYNSQNYVILQNTAYDRAFWLSV